MAVFYGHEISHTRQKYKYLSGVVKKQDKNKPNVWFHRVGGGGISPPTR